VKISLAFCGALLASAGAFAAPVVIPPYQTIRPTPYAQIQGLAMAGDEALFERLDLTYEPDCCEVPQARAGADLYRRAANGQWEFVRDFFSETYPWDGSSLVDASMSGSVAAVQVQSGLHLFQRNASGAWVEGVLDIARRLGREVEVLCNRVVAVE
jgi:hypothetical protein